tara:strand:+ start:51080 stop:51865 length:786 start_codon:yes stop_codon:yes gene_type:complete
MSISWIYPDDCIGLELDGEEPSLIYMDPPYGPKSEDTYYGVGDNSHDYLSYMHDRLAHMRDISGDSYNIVVHVDWKYVHNLKVMMDSIFGRDNFKNDIIWCFSNPSTNEKWLPRKHQNLLWYGIGDNVFNPIRIPHKTKMNVGGKNAWSKEKIPWEEYERKGKLLEDWWTDIPALCRNEPEKTGYATQKPLALMRRIISLWSNEGDTIIDPFMGSGSLLEAGIRMGRNVIGCDISPDAVETANRRIKKASRADIFAGSSND